MIAWKIRLRIFCVALLGTSVAVVIGLSQENIAHADIVICSIMLSIFSCWAMHRLVGVFHFRYLTIPGFWFLSYIPIIFVPSFFVFFDGNGTNLNVFLFAVNSLLITVPLGVYFCNLVVQFKRKEIKHYFLNNLSEREIKPGFFATCLLGLICALGLVLIYVYEVESIPLFYMLKNPGDYMSLVLLREESFKQLDSPLRYIYYLLRVFGFPLLIMLTLGYFLISKQRKWLILFLISLGSGLLFAAFSIAKMPVVTIIFLLFLFLYAYFKGRIKKKMIAIAFFFAMIFPIAVIIIISSDEIGLGTALSAIGTRIFYLPAVVVSKYFELFPDNVGFLYGRSIGKVALLMGWDYFDTPNYVGLYGFGSRVMSVSANGAFIGNLNADFGLPGVLFGGVFAGILMQGVQVYLVRQPRTCFNTAIYTYCIFAFSMLHSTALPIVLASNGVILALFSSRIFKISYSVAHISTRKVLIKQ